MSGTVPVGTICMWGGNTSNVDPDWMICDGGTLDTAKYPELYKVIQDAFGHNPPAGEFYLPDLRGYFVRGVDEGAGHDPEAAERIDPVTGTKIGDAVGTYQGDAVQDHDHSYNSFPNGRGDIASGRYWKSGGANTGGVAGANTSKYETRPKNIALYYIIKVQ